MKGSRAVREKKQCLAMKKKNLCVLIFWIACWIVCQSKKMELKGSF